MKAIKISKAGGPDVLTLSDVAKPEISSGEILIEVHYAGVNRPDCLQRAGLYAPPSGASPLPGLEASGVVVAVGEGVTQWSVGDQVCALLPGGGYAQYAICRADHALPIPKGVEMREAACLPETCFTVWSNVVMRGGLKSGERFLVHGGSSGIGTTAIQIAKSLGAEVFATAGSAAKVAAVEELGAHGINYRDADFVEVLTAHGGANLVLDMVGGSYISRNIKAMAPDARMVFIAFLESPKAEINFAQVMMKRLTITGSTLRPQSDAAKAEIATALREHVWPMIEAGALRPVMDQEFDLADARDAHRRMEQGDHIGKIVLRVK
ncbi:NAD(P)H-quinone oxidoreductase [Albirhodobacter sp. R86504]|uniref:NAD(P)H-quinone oxidoreductase n=1 Tax=Albirhodobacter sp. R86504 TaxID=3093848 RepID=UPI003672E5D3